MFVMQKQKQKNGIYLKDSYSTYRHVCFIVFFKFQKPEEKDSRSVRH